MHVIRSLVAAPPPPHNSPPSLHDALPISSPSAQDLRTFRGVAAAAGSRPPISPSRSRMIHRASISAATAARPLASPTQIDRKSTRLNSSHVETSYAVFCLKKKRHVSTSHN